MIPWEKEIAELLKADYVKLSHQSSSVSVDGNTPKTEAYLELDIINSKTLQELSINERLWTDKCDEIEDSILKAPVLNQLPGFNEVSIKIIQTGLSGETKTVSYQVH